MAEYRCDNCHLTMDADEEDHDCPMCGQEMREHHRKKNCSLRPSEQLGGIGG